MKTKEIKLTSNYLLVVEGESDQKFMEALIANRAIPNVQVLNPSQVEDQAGGRSTFSRVLNYLPMLDGFDNLHGILLVSDNDDDPCSSFLEVHDAIKSANLAGNQYPVPDKPRVKAIGKPSVAVLMLPGTGEKGNLETLCLLAAEQAHPLLIKCVDELMRRAQVTCWSASRQAKARLRAFLAIANKSRPDISFPAVWRECPGLFPLESRVFDPVAEFLRDFSTSHI